MNQSRQSDDLSFLNQSDHNILAPIATQQPFQKNPVFYQPKHPQKTSNTLLNVLSSNRTTNKLQFNDELIDYLALDENNSNLNIVTFIGPKQVGKSFLIDFIISKEEKSASRILSKNSKGLVNMPTYEVRGKNGEKMIFFDTHEDATNDVFLWTYFFSSMIVLNLPEGDRKAEQQFLAKLDHLRISLEAEPQDLSLPQLIILRRDANTKEFKDKEFLNKIESYHLFANDIATLNMAYPGSSGVSSKDIRDVSENLLSEAFVNDAMNLSWVLKSGRPKTIKGNYIGSKIAGLALEPVTQTLNKTGKLQTSKIWQQVIQTLSVGYYNFYMKRYSQQLQKQFADQQPCDKYTLYKRLSKIRRNIDKKFQGFNMIAGDPTFEKYRNKVQENIAKKEKVIREINKRKSIEFNDQLCKRLFSQMNDSNCEALIQQYCESKLDDNKTEVLLNNFEAVIKKRLAEVQKSKNPALKPSTQIQKLQRELRQIQQKIRQEKQTKVEAVQYDFVKIKANIDQKEQEVKELEAELEKQKKLSSQKRATQNKDIVELEQKIESLRATTKEQEAEIERLKASKEAQARETVESLNKKLKEQEERYQRLQAEVKKAQEASALNQKGTKPASKDTCCLVM